MRTRLCSVVLVGSLVLVGAGIGVGGAVASETWVAPAELSVPDTVSYRPQVSVDDTGNATAVWLKDNGAGSYFVQSSRRPAGGTWSTPVALSSGGVIGLQVASTPDGGAITVWSRLGSGVEASTRNAAGTWTAPETLGANAHDPQVVVDAAGRATVAWTRTEGADDRIQVTSRAVGGGWSLPVNLSEAGQDARNVALAVDDSGSVTAAWVRLDGSMYRVQSTNRPAGGEWTIPATLSEGGQTADVPRVAVAPSGGSATVTWIRPDGANNRLQSSTRSPAGSWSIPVTLSSAGADAFSTTTVAVDAAGVATVAWSHLVGGVARVLVSSRPPAGAWSEPTTVSDPGLDSRASAIAVARGGGTTVVWTQMTPTRVVAATRAPGGGWGAPTTLSGAGGSGQGGVVAADASGNAVAAWYYQPTGGTFRIQATALDAAGPVLTGFTAPATATAGQPAALSLSAYDVWSSVAGTTWSFGDGTTAPGAAVTHAWTVPGSYPVTATVTDSVGNSTTRTSTVAVAAAPTTATAAAPTIGKLRLTPRAIHLTGSKKDRRTKVTVTVSTASQLTLTFTRKGVKKPLRLTRKLEAGKSSFTLTAKLSRKKRLTVGTWKITAVATSPAGTSASKKVTLKVVR